MGMRALSKVLAWACRIGHMSAMDAALLSSENMYINGCCGNSCLRMPSMVGTDGEWPNS